MTDLEKTGTAAPTPMRQSPKRDRRSLMVASPASLRDSLRPEHPSVVEQYIMGRLPALLNLGYQPEVDGSTHAALVREFIGVLQDFPVWALAEAMDRWVDQHNRRPAPAELKILANRAMQPIGDALAERQRQAALDRQEAEARTRDRASPEAAARILAENGFTAARLDRVMRGETVRAPQSIDDLDRHSGAADPNAHWSDTAGPDDPRWDDLRRAREASPVSKMGETPKR